MRRVAFSVAACAVARSQGALGVGHDAWVSFFEPPPGRPEPVREQRQPDWAGPPDNVLGAAVPLRLLLARTDQAAVAVTVATAFPTGLLFHRTNNVASVTAAYIPRVKLVDQVGSWITLDAADREPTTFEIVALKRHGLWLVDYWNLAVGFN